jgi:hypothetical protein
MAVNQYVTLLPRTHGLGSQNLSIKKLREDFFEILLDRVHYALGTVAFLVFTGLGQRLSVLGSYSFACVPSDETAEFFD